MSAGQQAQINRGPRYPSGSGFVVVITNVGGAAVLGFGSAGGMLSTGTTTTHAPAWFNPQQAGIGNTHWVRLNRISGTGGNDGASVNTPLQLNVTRNFQQNPGGDGQFTVQIATDAAMATIVASSAQFRFNAS